MDTCVEHRTIWHFTHYNRGEGDDEANEIIELSSSQSQKYLPEKSTQAYVVECVGSKREVFVFRDTGFTYQQD